MTNLDRFGGEQAADAYFTALDEARERELCNRHCEECAKYHAAPILEKIGWCDYLQDYAYGDMTAHEAGCDEYE